MFIDRPAGLALAATGAGRLTEAGESSRIFAQLDFLEEGGKQDGAFRWHCRRVSVIQ